MTATRRRILTRKEALLAATAATAALSSQLLACDPMVPPAREPVPAADDAGVAADATPTAPAPDAGRD